MNSIFILLITIIGYALAYFVYGRFLSDKIFKLATGATPAHKYQDNIDYVPTSKPVLFGHHFATIAGLGPILGPAIGVIWGWLPAFLWVFFGSIFIGAVHDFSILAISLKNDGKFLGEIAENLFGKRIKLIFQILIFFMLSLAMGVFVFTITTLFKMYPIGVIPTFSLIFLAVCLGIIKNVWPKLYPIALIISIILMFSSIFYSSCFPNFTLSQVTWQYILLGYAFLASVLPVWLLLQPRDFLNSFLLYAGLIGMFAGIFVLHPVIKAPAINTLANDLPPMFPFLFITIACGAVSGFHNLASSGTTVRQLDQEKDALFIGYGAMLIEGILAVLVLLAATAGIESRELWYEHYSSWALAGGLQMKLGAFIFGAVQFLSSIGIPEQTATIFLSVMIVSFGLTTLDSATRLLRYNVEEIGRSGNIQIFKNRYISTLIAVLGIGYFAFMKVEGKSIGIILWKLFGSLNQLLAGLALFTVTFFLARKKINFKFAFFPMLFMLITSLTAMLFQLNQYITSENKVWSLIIISFAILLLTLWLIIETLMPLIKKWRK